MDFSFSDEQDLLRKTARDFLDEHAPMSHVREMVESPDGYSAELWRAMAALGWQGLVFPESYGGAGLTLVDLVPLLEELGRTLTPVPFLPSVIGGSAVLELGDGDQRRAWVPGICEGRVVATLALSEEGARDEPEGIRLEARRSATEWVMRGRKLFVPDAHVADVLVTVARTGGRGRGGLGVFLVPRDTPGVEIRPLATMDPLRRLCEVRFESPRLPGSALLGGGAESGPRLERLLDQARVMLCAEMVGGAEKCLGDAVEYSKTRVQFGRPIGVNQGIKHKCADMLFQTESSKSITYYAAWAANEEHEEAPLAASMAKAYLSDAYRDCAAENLQIHGGVGFTWEYDCHLYLKRAKSDEVWLGDAKYHRERIARLMRL